MAGEPEIYCPHCMFRPAALDRWECAPGCGTLWNTFWTHGVCPGCGHAWQHTQCLACFETSLHEAWYHHCDGVRASAAETPEQTVPMGDA